MVMNHLSWDKHNLIVAKNVFHHLSLSSSQDFRNYLVNSTTTRYRLIILDYLSLFTLRNKSHQSAVGSLVESTIHKELMNCFQDFMLYNVPSSLIKISSITISPWGLHISNASKSFFNLLVSDGRNHILPLLITQSGRPLSSQ